MGIELKRQLFHAIAGIVAVILLNYNILNLEILGMIIILGFIISIVSRKFRIPLISWFLKHMEREENLKRFPGKGALFYVMGIFFAVLLFRQETAYASILIMSLGDSTATYIGKRFNGRIRHPFSSRKYLEAALIGGFAGFLGAMLFINPGIALISSIAAMVFEGIDVKLGFTQVDDNLIIPVVAGLIITLLEAVL